MVRRFYENLRDGAELFLGKRDKFTPPRRLVTGIGGGDFRLIGEEFRRYFFELGGLKADMRMLDVGCGCGRMALPLLDHFSAQGGYWGFDIVEAGIVWCQKNIAAQRANFHFELADVFNRAYHPKGRLPAAEYRFPYAGNFFDFVALTSVFTHMLAPDMGHYLGEIARVMKPGGRCLITFFLLNEESEGCLQKGLGTLNFPHAETNCRVSQKSHPEAAVAFEETFIRQACVARGLELLEPIHYGSWCGRSRHLSYQDVLLATKPERPPPV